MLVRFLSFAASIIGTRRYRPALISLTMVVLSMASIAAVASVLGGDPHSAASTSGQKSTPTERQATPSLDDLDRQVARQEPTPPSVDKADPPAIKNESDKATSGSSTTGQGSLPAPDITLSTTTLTLSSSNPTLAISASMSDKSTVTWSVVADNPGTDVSAAVEQAAGGQQGASLRFRLNQDAESGTYQFTITAKDAVRGLDVSKKVTITVNS